MSKAARGVGAVLLLCGSNSFMNTAWYLHLKFTAWPLVAAIFISWGIAFFEYCLQVPANRLGHYEQGGPFTAPQLKVIQEAISLTTFAIFSVLVLKEKLRWTDYIAFALVFGGVAVSLAKPLASKDVAALPELEAPAPEPAAEAAAAVPPASPALQLAEGGAAARSPAPRQESSGEGRKLLVQLTPLSHAGGGTAAEEVGGSVPHELSEGGQAAGGLEGLRRRPLPAAGRTASDAGGEEGV